MTNISSGVQQKMVISKQLGGESAMVATFMYIMTMHYDKLYTEVILPLQYFSSIMGQTFMSTMTYVFVQHLVMGTQR